MQTAFDAGPGMRLALVVRIVVATEAALGSTTVFSHIG